MVFQIVISYKLQVFTDFSEENAASIFIWGVALISIEDDATYPYGNLVNI
jgi:hypothetical protein